jgi:hypothetical protein
VALMDIAWALIRLKYKSEWVITMHGQGAPAAVGMRHVAAILATVAQPGMRHVAAILATVRAASYAPSLAQGPSHFPLCRPWSDLQSTRSTTKASTS